MDVIFGIDVGGTNIKFGKFYSNSVEKFMVATMISDDENVIIEQICDEISNHLNGDNLIGIGIGIPGPVVNGVVLGAQNIKWKKVSLKEKILKRFPDIKVEILNDANSATIGEWYFGSGDKLNSAVFITLGTGVGGGIIINGKLVEGSTGSCGEVGHIKIFPSQGRECTCGLNGCLEQYTSATGIVKTAKELSINRKTVLNEHKDYSCKDIFNYAMEEDEVALEVVDRTAYYLGIGLANIANTINPDIIMIGGGVSKAGDFLIDKVRKYFKELAFYSVRETKIVLATLSNDAGIYGCYAKVKIELGL